MKLAFDIKGNLTPYERTELTLDEFKNIFVDSFEPDSTRFQIFENYLQFLDDFQKEITSDFIHWINGSFVSNKKNPKDIDFVTLINHEIYRKKRNLIDDKFRLKKAKELYKVDAYSLEIYKEDHKKHLICKSDLVYWDTWFSKTKKDWKKKTYPKGYVEINFSNE